jgi:uncharacterized protein YpmB
MIHLEEAKMSKPIKIILGIVLVIVIALIAAGNYFYSYAVVPAKKDFLAESSDKKSKELIAAEDCSIIKITAQIGS